MPPNVIEAPVAINAETRIDLNTSDFKDYGYKSYFVEPSIEMNRERAVSKQFDIWDENEISVTVPDTKVVYPGTISLIENLYLPKKQEPAFPGIEFLIENLCLPKKRELLMDLDENGYEIEPDQLNLFIELFDAVVNRFRDQGHIERKFNTSFVPGDGALSLFATFSKTETRKREFRKLSVTEWNDVCFKTISRNPKDQRLIVLSSDEHERNDVLQKALNLFFDSDI